MKVLLFGDGPHLKEKGKLLREQNGWTVHLRSIARWAGDVEKVDAVYFLTPADAIRAAYKARGIDCFLVEEPKDEADTTDASDTDETGNAGASATGAAEGEAGQTVEKADKPVEIAPAPASKAKASGAAARKAR